MAPLDDAIRFNRFVSKCECPSQSEHTSNLRIPTLIFIPQERYRPKRSPSTPPHYSSLDSHRHTSSCFDRSTASKVPGLLCQDSVSRQLVSLQLSHDLLWIGSEVSAFGLNDRAIAFGRSCQRVIHPISLFSCHLNKLNPVPSLELARFAEAFNHYRLQ
jgi:hypothetical protein